VSLHADEPKAKDHSDRDGGIYIYPEFVDGLDGYSDLYVLVYFDRL